jgi:cysteinylglycine-S-conjugate dipeptidase
MTQARQTVSTEAVQELRDRVAGLLPAVRADLEALVRIPSVSAPAFDQAPLDESAAAVAHLLRDAGVPDVQILRAGDSAPAVVGRRPGPPGSPTVLLYAHHDVQPPGQDVDWDTPPFEPSERDDRLYGRGSADDKAGVMTHVAALRALGADLPVGVVVFVEGEEEIGSPNFAAFLERYRDELAADVIVVADSANWTVDVPALTTTLRGLVDGTITVSTLGHALHSGLYGGVVPDAMMATIRLLNTLWDDAGDLAIPGLVTGQADVDYPEADLRADSGVLDGVQLIGSGTLAARIWTRPSLTIIGIDAPAVNSASNTLLPSVRVKFSLRIAPGQDPQAAFGQLRDAVLARAPFGAHVDVTQGELGRAFAADSEGEVYAKARWALGQAWGTESVDIGIGGSIPFIADLLAVYPEATVLVTGVEDPDSRAHGPNESLHLGVFGRACLAEALFLKALGS